MEKYLSVQDVIDLFEKLSYSQGFYGRLLAEINACNEEEFAAFEAWVEDNKFMGDLDVILAIEC